MKIINKIYSLLIAAVLMLAIGCTETETQAVLADQFVAFSSASGTIQENATDSVTVQVLMAAPLQTSDVTVDYTLELVSGTDSDFTLSNNSGTMTIPAGEASALIEIRPIDNVFADGPKELVFTITSVSGGLSIGLPGPAAANTSSTITIGDDDCPIDLSAFAGEWTYIDATGKPGSCCDGGTLSGYGITHAGGNATLTADASDPSGTTAILSGGPFGSDYTIKFLTCPGEVVALSETDSFLGRTAWNMGQGQTNGTYTATTISVVGVLGTNGDFEMVFEKAD